MMRPKGVFLRASSLLLALLLIPMCVSCNDKRGSGDGTTDGGTPDAAETVILCSELSKYKFIRPENAGQGLTSAFIELYKSYGDAAGADIEQSDDFYREGVPGLEIAELEVLVGNTNRPESRQFLNGLRADDYGYALIGKKLVIAGHTEENTIKAIEEFSRSILSRYEKDKSRGDFISSAENYIYNSVYAVDSMTLCGVDIREWRIVYPSKHPMGEDIAAEQLQSKIAALCGYYLEAVKVKEDDGEGRYEISVGETARTDAALVAAMKKAGNSSYIGYSDKQILLGGGDSTALLGAVVHFGNEITGAMNTSGRNVTLTLAAEKLYESNDGLLTAMSFNHLVRSKTDARIERVIKMVLKYLPDTVGFQETSPSWMDILTSRLGSIYAYVGEGRDVGGKGEHTPIFYNKSKFKLVTSGTRWLSDTPEVVSKYEESSLNRIFTYALLERTSDGVRFMVINTHLEHTSEAARVKQIKVLLDHIDKTCRDYPIVLTGDFNCTSSSSVYASIKKSGLSDSADVAMRAKRAATFTNYGQSNKVIDFIFVTADRIAVSDYSVCNEKIDGDYPSDHHPVLIKYSIGK